MVRLCLQRIVFAILTMTAVAVQAVEIGHYAPGVMSIRDFAMPAPGYYTVVYNYFYMTDRVNNADGNEIDQITISPGGGSPVTLDLDVDVSVYALAPTFIWVSEYKFLGGTYGAFISPMFGNTSVGASLAVQTGSARSVEESQFSIGDLLVQPVWVGWAKPNWDFAAGYALYVPIGQYDTELVTLPIFGPAVVESADNIGLGFWTNQFQGTAAWYPWLDKRMSVATALTYEIHGEKEGFDVTPGQNLAINWGVSQYLPLKKDQTLLAEVGPAGYSSWQVTDDSGAAAGFPPVRDQVHGVGGQVGITSVPWNAAFNFRYLYEFASQHRFQGQSVGLNFAIKL